ncbi:hypothetical protein GMST_42880 [Geomonas silvestris]|uniref:Uncharacterized protein n=1 Tax=Geomonas silvestris TaxID=2740184 RepID=A0A6V8MQG7_9BACT|nr:hypothetical protein [Geomonas silvestris]GFO61963.1 hypothetical protein GMST_42880 [Geomonas silvestris]
MWEASLQSAEKLLNSPRIPSCEEIITLIKRVNPTSLQLSEAEREQGYRVKNRLQNLLLEEYGATFHLVNHPFSPDIILIKHTTLPSVDACHADLKALSPKALDTVGALPSPQTAAPAQSEGKKKGKKTSTDSSPRETLANAEALLAQYEYPQAGELLNSLRISDMKELPLLAKAARLLVEEMGAYPKAIELLLAQPKQVLRDKSIRELLALTYYGNGMVPEARALFGESQPADLGKMALLAYADLCFKDGNLTQAYHLLKRSEEKEGFVAAFPGLRKEIETALTREAEPFYCRAEKAYAEADIPRTELLLNQALSLYPDFQRARQLAREVEAGKARSRLADLWASFESCEVPAKRLELLLRIQELDKAGADNVKNLIAREKQRLNQESVAEQLRALEQFAAQKNWEECIDSLLRLSRQAEQADFARACRISPLFSVLDQNRRLQRLSPDEIKKSWLDFVRLKRLEEEETGTACWELAQELKPLFQGYPEFHEVYQELLEQVRENEREEIYNLLERLDELRQQEEPPIAEVKQLVAQMRRLTLHLPAGEAAELRKAAEGTLTQLTAADAEDLGDLETALRLGNAATAARIKAYFGEPWYQPMVASIEEKVATAFHIEATPIDFSFAPELVVDLSTRNPDLGLCRMGSSEHHLVLREAEDTLIVVDLRRQAATRYRSENFKDLELMDVLPDRDLFLLINVKNKVSVWRTLLCGEQSRFTAQFEINENFFYGAGACFMGLFMSSVKDNVYFAFIQEGERFRGVKMSLDLESTVIGACEYGSESCAVHRLSNQPDRFLVMTEHLSTVLEGNFTTSRGQGWTGVNFLVEPFGIDRLHSLIYARGDGIVNVLNTKLRAIKQHLNAESVWHFTMPDLAHICTETQTMLLDVGGVKILYNMVTNKFSQKFSASRLWFTATPRRSYFWEFDDTKSALRIKDVSRELENLLEWRTLLPKNSTEEDAALFVHQLEDLEYFTVVKPAGPERLAEEAASSAGGNLAQPSAEQTEEGEHERGEE